MEKPTDKGMDDVDAMQAKFGPLGFGKGHTREVITAYKAWLKDNGWAIVRKNLTVETAGPAVEALADASESEVYTAFDGVVAVHTAIIKEGEMK